VTSAKQILILGSALACFACGASVDGSVANTGGAGGMDAAGGTGGAPFVAGDAALSDLPPDCRVTFAVGPSRCTITDTHAECTHVDLTIGGRLVVSQTPLGTPPPAGWPAVVVYQGSLYGPTLTWAGDTTMPFGGFNQVKLQAMLLDNGFVVIAPSADGVAWNTNFPGYETSSDSRFIPILLEEIKRGTFGQVDGAHLYATGISSGGYMTSRMAVSYPGEFGALAISSGSYATCSGSLCTIPDPLPADHPPTLFLHGQNDIVVPIATAQAYEAQLQKQGIETAMRVDPNASHQWLSIAPESITCWFQRH
jgi:poly(3-hydroxyoctanoate) depolymerase